jgi:hypothetical protein
MRGQGGRCQPSLQLGPPVFEGTNMDVNVTSVHSVDAKGTGSKNAGGALSILVFHR